MARSYGRQDCASHYALPQIRRSEKARNMPRAFSVARSAAAALRLSCSSKCCTFAQVNRSALSWIASAVMLTGCATATTFDDLPPKTTLNTELQGKLDDMAKSGQSHASEAAKQIAKDR
jgi:hypothetical protein